MSLIEIIDEQREVITRLADLVSRQAMAIEQARILDMFAEERSALSADAQELNELASAQMEV